MKRALVAITAVLLLAAALPAGAAAAGGFAGSGDVFTERTGIVDPDTGVRYFALAGGHGADLIRVDPDASAGSVALEQTRLSDRNLTIPAAALDGTTTGLSADGRTLALADPYIVPGQATTHMALVDTKRMRVEKRLRLPGAFAFDAISPDGSQLYLIRYPNPRDPLDYEVRAWDVDRGRLLPEPIVDSREPEEEMRGTAVTRVVSPDGAWVLTLYDGAGKEPFVHALNTVEGTAFCVDLDMVSAKTVYRDRLQPVDDWSSVAVVDRNGAELASISTDTWTATASDAPAAESGGDLDWWLLAAGLLAAAATAIAVARRLHGGAQPGGGSAGDPANP
jgi:hypothetical protein